MVSPIVHLQSVAVKRKRCQNCSIAHHFSVRQVVAQLSEGTKCPVVASADTVKELAVDCRLPGVLERILLHTRVKREHASFRGGAASPCLTVGNG